MEVQRSNTAGADLNALLRECRATGRVQVRLRFQSSFRQRYQRENRLCSPKILRCFPACITGEAHCKRFCNGTPICLRMTSIRRASDVPAIQLCVVGEFQTMGPRSNPITEPGLTDAEWNLRQSNLIAARKQFVLSEERMGYVREEIDLLFDNRPAPWSYAFNPRLGESLEESLHCFVVSVLMLPQTSSSSSSPSSTTAAASSSIQWQLVHQVNSPLFSLQHAIVSTIHEADARDEEENDTEIDADCERSDMDDGYVRSSPKGGAPVTLTSTSLTTASTSTSNALTSISASIVSTKTKRRATVRKDPSTQQQQEEETDMLICRLVFDRMHATIFTRISSHPSPPS